MNLKSLNKTLCTMVVMALCAGAVNAQEAPKQDAPKPSPVDVSGVLFFDYSYILENKDKVTNTKKTYGDSFNLNRAYLTAQKKIDDVWSARVTLDAGTVENSDAFVKNAYVQMAPKFGDVGLKLQGGLVGTPIIGLLDGFTGSRWIYQNYVDKAKDLTDKDIDVSSADTGLKGELNIVKIVTITGMYSNGDGYKKNTTDQNTVTKSNYLVVNVTPFSALNVFGYYHWHDTAAKSKENYVSYVGGGAAWSDKAIKVGASYTMASGKAANLKEESTIIEVWANVNLQQFAGVPVLLIGRYAMGKYEKDATPNKLKNEGSAIWAGVGYQVNSNVQLAAMYKVDSITDKNATGAKTKDLENSTMFVKSEIKF